MCIVKGMKNQNRDFELEAIVGNMPISQYQSHILKSRISDMLDGWWVLSQDRDRNSSSFTLNRERKEFKVSLISVNDLFLR
jgi:hypothetical protein